MPNVAYMKCLTFWSLLFIMPNLPEPIDAGHFPIECFLGLVSFGLWLRPEACMFHDTILRKEQRPPSRRLFGSVPLSMLLHYSK